MADKLSKKKRSWNMGRIKSKDTKPELIVRSVLHQMGYRFTINGPYNNRLPGKPDIVLPKHNTGIFVHGCFWHQHRICREGRKPGTNKGYWGEKLDKNVTRDRRNQRALRKLGWQIAVIWECEIEEALKSNGIARLIADRTGLPVR